MRARIEGAFTASCATRLVPNRVAVRPSASASSEQLVSALSDPNAWWRRTAQRLLVSRADRAVVASLVRAAADAPTGPGRLHALWTLDGLGALDAASITRALADTDPGVRENAVLLAEKNGSIAGLDARLTSLASDPDPRVRFQVLATLGSIDTPAATAAHEQLLFSGLADEWMQIAGLSAGSDRAARYFERATTGAGALTAEETEGHARFVRQVASVIGARQQAPEICERDCHGGGTGRRRDDGRGRLVASRRTRRVG